MVGNKPNYTKFDVLRCFFRIGEGISRHNLAKSLELGEGTIRTILGILKNKKLIESTKKGHFLSSRGNSEMSKLKENMALPSAFGIIPTFASIFLVSSTFLPSGLSKFFVILFFVLLVFLKPIFHFVC